MQPLPTEPPTGPAPGPAPGPRPGPSTLGSASGDLGVARALVVKLTCGLEAPERLSQGFTVAATAVASGVAVSLWLTGEAAWMAVPGRADAFSLPYAAPITDLRDSVLSGGRMTLCSQCAARRELSEDDLIEGVTIRGAAAFVEEVLQPGAQALVY
jgi:predicted peroxiredoxin